MRADGDDLAGVVLGQRHCAVDGEAAIGDGMAFLHAAGGLDDFDDGLTAMHRQIQRAVRVASGANRSSHGGVRAVVIR